MKCIKIFRGTLEQKEDKEKCSKGTDDEGHNAFFRMNFTGKISFLEHRMSETSEKVWRSENLP